MDSNNFSKVYINPNFNRTIVSNNQHYTSMPHGNAMHLNPNFSTAQNNKKIYINPNFIPSTSHHVQSKEQCTQNRDKKKYVSKDSGETSFYTNTASVCTKAPSVCYNGPAQIQQPMAKKSRYHIVRHNENKPPVVEAEKKTDSLTVKLSKYKSVRITEVKSHLDGSKQPPKQYKSSVKPIQSSTHVYNQQERIVNTTYNHHAFNTPYTYVNNKQVLSNMSRKTFRSQYSFVKNRESPKKTRTNKQTSTIMSVKNTSKLKIRKLKVKCNTPCRLFRKYGKCLRNARGYCKYLHDKKHVSICRKFLKGICHDKDCLLSHELSDKKMPTCYFYLQGMCTKEGCPYLHVKVNDKAIVCPDFKKGYCERGNKCLNRHVETTKKSVQKFELKTKSANNNKINISDNSSKKNNTTEIQGRILPGVAQDQTTAVSESRYYKEVIVDTKTSDTCQVIKPTRCKLGILPSFIKL